MRRTALLASLALATTAAAGEKQPTNRLAKESSPYLLQHAHNPVDWYPWGRAAFAKAKKENKPVFLSVGYSSCHWCHVMERESFADKGVAALMNKHFVCIKVDREERPDVDRVYMAALNITGASGGWPLSMFLTPEGKPIFGGTYWPKEDRVRGGQVYGGFKSVLKRVHQLWADKPDALRAQSRRLAKAVNQYLAREDAEEAAEFDPKLVAAAAESLADDVDPRHGGFGKPATEFAGPKFPMPSAVGLLLGGDAGQRKLAHLTLREMALGGIFDHLGGGFHRYSTERTWTVPHFEKMLYDNAQLVELYSRAYRFKPDPLYRTAVVETLNFIKREMTAPEGVFYSALDADSEGEEGRFYIWAVEQIDAILKNKAERKAFKAAYEIGEPNFEGKYIILTRDPKVADTPGLRAAERELFAARSERERPFRDTKILTGWNGLMIAAYADAGRAFKRPEYTQAAARAADFLLKNARDGRGRLQRVYVTGKAGRAKVLAYQDDYAFLAHGLLNLHAATGEARWLKEAERLTGEMTKMFGGDNAGGYYYTSAAHEKLFARGKDFADGALPSGNSVAGANLLRLAKATGREPHRAAAKRLLAEFARRMREMPRAGAALMDAYRETGS